tara:strand:+ start:1736 stop:2044 length:309 start_codon:yes stop_codon:yes gene_type:complete
LLISYDTELLQEICYRTLTAVEYLGEESAASLQTRHSEIQAARNVFELLVGKVTIEENTCTLEVPNLVSIQMVPNYGPLGDGELYDWATVARIKIVGINDVK